MTEYGKHCACPCARKLSECAALTGTGASCRWQAAPNEMVQEWRDIFFKLADLAKIKGDREVFCMAGYWMSVSLIKSQFDRDDLADDLFLTARDAIRRAADAVSALNENQKRRVGEFFYRFINRESVVKIEQGGVDYTPYLGNWPRLLSQLADAFSLVAWKQPGYHPRIGAGGRKGRRADFPFRCLVSGLLLIANEFGGKLTFDHKAGRGSLLDAIELMRSHSFCRTIIPNVPPISTIRRVVENRRTEVAA
jgi:hypothetical protein